MSDDEPVEVQITVQDVIRAAVQLQTDDIYQQTKILYDHGFSAAACAEILRVSTATVYDRLKKARAGEVPKKGGPPKKAKCKNGHDMDKFGKKASNGGRYCSECKRIKERVGGK